MWEYLLGNLNQSQLMNLLMPMVFHLERLMIQIKKYLASFNEIHNISEKIKKLESKVENAEFMNEKIESTEKNKYKEKLINETYI